MPRQTFQLHERNASIVEGVCIARLERNRLVVAGECLVETLQLHERNAAIVEGFYVLRVNGNRLVETGQRRDASAP